MTTKEIMGMFLAVMGCVWIVWMFVLWIDSRVSKLEKRLKEKQ